MNILPSGSSYTFTLPANNQLTVTSRGGTTVTGPGGLLGTIDGTRTFGGYGGDTIITIAAVGNDCEYGVTEPGNAKLTATPSGGVAIAGPSANYGVSGVVPSGLTTSHIIDAMNYLATRGGGIVQLQPDTYTHTADIPFISGVHVIGAPYAFSFTGNVPDSRWTYADGSRILGTGVETVFYGNNVDQGSPAAQFAVNAISGANLKNIIFDNCLNAVDAGAVNNMGLFGVEFENLYLINSGMNVENFQQSLFRRIYANIDTAVAASGRGIRFASSVAQATLVPGDSIIDNFFRRTNGVYHDPVTFEALAGCALNNLILPRVHVNRYDSGEFSATATFTNGSANISVPDSTLWPVGLPVMFKATVAGFTANYIYFVLTSAANVITLGTYYDSTAQSASASTTGTMYSGGFPNIAIIGRNAGGVLSNMRIRTTLEATNAVGLVAQNTSGGEIEVTDVLPNQHQHVVLRTATNGAVKSQYSSLKTDFDNGAAYTKYDGVRGTITNRIGWGNWNGHFYGTPGVSATSGTANGTTGTVALANAVNSGGTITVTPGGTGIGAGVVATVTFSNAKEFGYVSLTPMNAAAVALQQSANALRMQDPARSTSFDLVTDGALTSGTAYKFGWQSI